MKLTTKTIRKTGGSRWLLVLRGASELGVISKYRDDEQTRNPWTVFAGVGDRSRLVGHVWGSQANAVAKLAKHLGIS